MCTNYYPQVVSKECKYIVNKKMTSNFTDDPETFCDDSDKEY